MQMIAGKKADNLPSLGAREGREKWEWMLIGLAIYVNRSEPRMKPDSAIEGLFERALAHMIGGEPSGLLGREPSK